MCMVYMLIEHTLIFHCLTNFFHGTSWRTSTELPPHQRLLFLDHAQINTVIITKICRCSTLSQESVGYFDRHYVMCLYKNNNVDNKFIIQVFIACIDNVATEVSGKRDAWS
jgi:hypothetical protein